MTGSRSLQRRSSTLQQLVSVPVSLVGASTFPLALLLRVVGLSGIATRLSDDVLAALGLVRLGTAEAHEAHEARLRAQLRERLQLVRGQLQTCEAARRALERENSSLRAQAPQGQGAGTAVHGPLLHALYASCVAAVLALAALVDGPHQSLERKLVTVALVPSALLFVLQAGDRGALASVAQLALHSCVTGFVLHRRLLG